MHTLDQLRTGQLAGLKQLNLSAGLTEFPQEIFDLADTLEVLNLSGNALSSLPDDLGRLHRLRIIFCSDNDFTEVPAVLGQCPQLSMVGFKANRIRTLPGAALTPALRWLILTDNQLEALPPEIGNCQTLQKLMLAGNQLTELPATLARCTNLELLRIAANQLTELPKWLLAMPKLAWLAYAGNPFYALTDFGISENQSIGIIPWKELAVEHQLGEGASGVIYQARWHQNEGLPKAVAVKLFKGALTSDGLPQSEMAACIGAGAHPNLIGVAGQVSQHPAQAQGLVMELISPAFGNLAGPPSLATCTRDVYAAGASFTLAMVLCIAGGIAAATQHLHERGILHGDLYAHNVLTTAAGEALLGDFGAASFFSPHDITTSHALQQLEARAFSCLLEELLAHCHEAPTTQAAVEALHRLRQRCAHPDVSARPLFREIKDELEQVGHAVSLARK
ncbi:serine/threonine-protein kinase [Hymenobacter sp. BT683]|uniref:Serine/threonine-protein kinase n=1 Tax=Hymenobacter jeongseonensis TaxID=2791027 RepID=A0ABS0II22_9BACT|nr:leucine-rich repeat-containing protein kinase family protein [Hymenobacter jeongseonensis]MBF9237988.1 serine/threonine-protein kinase [Hymenobacter jeongseonensis]